MRYQAKAIVYDTDGETVDDLPHDMIVDLPDGADPALHLEDAISDRTGWCVTSFTFETAAVA